ncbi:MAG: sodium:proton antiporter [Planctomycetes bacterium]|nr:sodium:proton antiporter [Planctomycetota bacterium]
MQRIVLSVAVAVTFLAAGATTALADGHAAGPKMGQALYDSSGYATLLPFAALLLSIAVFPLAAPHWWEHNKSKGIVAAVLAAPLAIYLVMKFNDGSGTHRLLESAHEYVSFIALLGSLFVISGGIYMQGSLSGTPLINTLMLALGAVIANLVGTTGASVLLIRPLLRANKARQNKAHIVVFFIFVVSNCGGLLTPLGDPPLFLGFLRGVPFEWTLQLWPQWLMVNGALLVIFNVWDQMVMNKEERERPGDQYEEVMQHEPLRVLGLHNILFLLGIVATIIFAGQAVDQDGHSTWPKGMQEGIMVALALAAYFTTSGENRAKNKFTFGPIIEVAVLFAGIFVTMIPALEILNVKGESLGLSRDQEWHFFWAAGILSSFLDNAPTYLTFAATAAGMEHISTEGRYLAEYLAAGAKDPSGVPLKILAAISCGAVFMGANTYIGNGPNFMVKAIAEENGVKMPGFFGYMVYSCGILIPLFIAVTFVFFK